MLFVDEFCGILVYIKFGADVTSQYHAKCCIYRLYGYSTTEEGQEDQY